MSFTICKTYLNEIKKKKTKYGSRILKYLLVFSLISPGFLLILPNITTCRKKYVFLQVISKVKGEKWMPNSSFLSCKDPFQAKNILKEKK